MLVKSTRLMKNWDESTTQESGKGLKTSHALVTYELSGDIEGESKLDYSMVYLPNSKTLFTGYELVSGAINGSKGSFVLLHEGIFDASGAKMTVTIVADSGCDELEEIQGSGEIESDIKDPMKAYMTIDIALP
ncbi:MAG: DUF3224 domain-containing protein [Pseudomonadota bacterium]